MRGTNFGDVKLEDEGSEGKTKTTKIPRMMLEDSWTREDILIYINI